MEVKNKYIIQKKLICSLECDWLYLQFIEKIIFSSSSFTNLILKCGQGNNKSICMQNYFLIGNK